MRSYFTKGCKLFTAGVLNKAAVTDWTDKLFAAMAMNQQTRKTTVSIVTECMIFQWGSSAKNCFYLNN